MIPINIQIKNFLSYGDQLQTIDFSPYNLVCLSGKNGHGKSALLDAITWAIWGQARKTGGTAKADQGLLRLGQTHMLVILDFECNNTHYRIRREFALTYGKPYAAVDFGIVQEDKQTIIPLTEKTIRGTQEKIEKTIHLDYESFINSAFLRQGHANEFSKKSPKDRKEILANILGLQQYELLRKAASDSSREKSTEKQQLLNMQTKIEQELTKTVAVQTALTQTKQQIIEHAVLEKKLITDQKDIQQQQATLMRLKHEEQQAHKELLALKDDYAELTQELTTLFCNWRTTHKQQLALGSYDLLKQQKSDLTAQLETMQKQLQHKLAKQELYLKEQQATAIIEQQLKHEQMQRLQQKQLQLHYAQSTMKELTQKIEICLEQKRLCNEQYAQTESKLKLSQQYIQQHKQTDLDRQEQLFEKRRTYYQQWIAQANIIKSEYEQIEHKKQLVDDIDSPSCPLCEQNLSATRKKFLKQKLAKHEQFVTHRYHRLKQLIVKLKPLLITQHEELTLLKQHHQLRAVEEEKIKQLQLLCSELDGKQKKAHDEEVALKQQFIKQETLIKEHELIVQQETLNAQHELQQHPLYKERFIALQTLKQEYESIIYNQNEQTKVQEQLAAIDKQLSLYTNMQQETVLQNERAKQITVLCQKNKLMKQQLHLAESRLKEYATIADLEKTYQQAETTLQTQKIEWNKKNELVLQEIGRLEQQYAHLTKLKEEHAAQHKQIALLTQEIDDYQEISSALSKNGIQALLIEDAIPEIEQEANELLSKLTENQATILIESLRDLKSGGTRETLDIHIADAIGIRPYELFSGGEAFRIDFSLRIAISKLLARRAGTSLQTLIIDEGFGSQDEEGLSYIMDAIYKIQRDFKKIIIVSHLPRMKDQFPVHFHIHKSPQGSSVDIMEQA